MKKIRTIKNFNNFKKLNEENSKKDNIKITFRLNSPYKWGKGWTATKEMLDKLNDEAIDISNNLHLKSELSSFGVVQGESSFDNSNIISSYMHPMEFVFELDEYNKTDVELIKHYVEKGLEKLNTEFPISIESIRMKDKEGNYSDMSF